MQDPTMVKQTERQCQAALKRYLESPPKGLPSDVDPESAIGFVKLFLDACYKELGTAPAELSEEQLREVLLTRLGKRISPKRRDADHAIAVIREYRESLLGDGEKLDSKTAKVFDEVQKVFPKVIRGEVAVDVERAAPLKNEAEKVGRNDPCPCGSGKKFKKCCVTA